MSRRCLRCGREMTVSHDTYGWRCAQILGVDQRGLREARAGNAPAAARPGYGQGYEPVPVLLAHASEDGGGYGGGYGDRSGGRSTQGYDRRRYEALDDYEPPAGFRDGRIPGTGELYSFAEYVYCMDCDEEYMYLLIDLYNSIDDTSN